MNAKITKTSDSHRLLLNLTDKINLKRSDKYVALSNLTMCYTWKAIKLWYKKNASKILAPTWNKEFDESPDGSYSVSAIPKYFGNILKNMEKRLMIIIIL